MVDGVTGAGRDNRISPCTTRTDSRLSSSEGRANGSGSHCSMNPQPRVPERVLVPRLLDPLDEVARLAVVQPVALVEPRVPVALPLPPSETCTTWRSRSACQLCPAVSHL